VLDVLTGGYESYLGEFKADGEAAAALLAVGHSEVDEELDAAELAACTAVASVILNLDETVTKE
jgi:hypothetical protein